MRRYTAGRRASLSGCGPPRSPVVASRGPARSSTCRRWGPTRTGGYAIRHRLLPEPRPRRGHGLAQSLRDNGTQLPVPLPPRSASSASPIAAGGVHPASAPATAHGLAYRVRSRREVDWTLLANLDFLADFLGEQHADAPEPAVAEILSSVRQSPASPYARCSASPETRAWRRMWYTHCSSMDTWFSISRRSD